MTTYNTYKMSKVIKEKMKADLVELGHSPSSSYFEMDREEIDDFIKLFHALPYTEYTQLLDEWKFYTTYDVFHYVEKRFNDTLYDMSYYDFTLEEILEEIKSQGFIQGFMPLSDNDLWLLKE